MRDRRIDVKYIETEDRTALCIQRSITNQNQVNEEDRIPENKDILMMSGYEQPLGQKDWPVLAMKVSQI